MKIYDLVLPLMLILVFVSCNPKKAENSISNPVLIPYIVQGSIPHDTKSFTQGLLIHAGQLYESTGQDDSWIGIVDVQTGAAQRKVTLEKKYFGEGIVILNNKVYQLTWKNKTGFIYSLSTFEKLGEFNYESEGWGLTTDGINIIMSDGTDKLFFLDTTKLSVARTISVTYDKKPVTALNELEYVDGFVYANMWQTAMIAKIDAATGEVKGFLDLSALVRQTNTINPQAEVLNGIAWHPATKLMLVTGKYWPSIYMLRLK